MKRPLVRSLLAVAALMPLTARAAGTPASGVSVGTIVVASDYTSSHTVYAVGQRGNCSSGCVVLLRSRDGGATWSTATAAGWQHNEVLPVDLGGRPTLLTTVSGGYGLSFDQGESFQPFQAPGSPSATAPAGTHLDVVLSETDGTADHLLSLPSGTVRPVAGDSALKQMSITPTPAYPHAPAGVPGAIGLGLDPTSNTAHLAWCDDSLTCTTTAPVSSGGKLVFSPHFGHDLTVFLLTPKGLLRSTDGGRSLTPMTVMPAGAGTLITTVTALALTPDFDASAGRGAMFAAVVSASKANNGTLNGGVFRSNDAGATWTASSGSGGLDGGASALALAPDGRLFAGALQFGASPGGVYCSTDGATWNAACPLYAIGGGAGSTSGSSSTHKGNSGAVAVAPASEAAGASATGGPQQQASGGHELHLERDSTVTVSGATRGREVGLVLLVAALLAVGGVVRRQRNRRKGGEAGGAGTE